MQHESAVRQFRHTNVRPRREALLRHEVESLLAHDSLAASAFLEPPGGDGFGGDDGAAFPEFAGAYKILQVLGDPAPEGSGAFRPHDPVDLPAVPEEDHRGNPADAERHRRLYRALVGRRGGGVVLGAPYLADLLQKRVLALGSDAPTIVDALGPARGAAWLAHGWHNRAEPAYAWVERVAL